MKFYATFGVNHPEANCYVEIVAPDKASACTAMSEKYNREWSMMYESPEAAGVEQFKLRKIAWIDASKKPAYIGVRMPRRKTR